jgi:iron complex outermembrane recepter protein
MRQRLRLLHLVFLLTPVVLVPAFAQEEEAGEEKTDTHVVVTATRLDDPPARTAELPASVTVIDREAILRSGARTVQDLLALEAGVVVYDQVGNDVEKTVDLRGFSRGRGIAVFVDGARFNDPRNNAVALEQIPLAAIERIEITRGSTSALAGGGSEAGVVNIVTRRGGTDPQAGVSIAAGTYDTVRLDGSYGQTLGRFDVLGAVSHDGTDGFRINADGEQTRANATVGFDLHGDRRIALSALWSDLSYGNPGALTLAEFDADPGSNVFNVVDESERRTAQGALNFQGPVGSGFSLAANLSFRDEIAKTLSTGRAAPAFGGFFLDSDGATWSGTVQATRPFAAGPGSHVLSFGFEGLNGEIDSLGFFTSPTGDYDPQSPSSVNTVEAVNGALFVQDAWTPTPRWTVVAGARGDRNRVTYDEAAPNPTAGDARTFSEVSFRGGATFRPSEALDVHLSVADAFLPPTPEELFAFPGFFSNPDLSPQDSRTYELGARARGSRGTVETAVFWIDTKDEIVFDPTPILPDFPGGRNVNAGSTRRRGVELSLEGRLARRVLAFSSLTYTDSEFTGGPNDGNTIPLVPEFRAAAGIDAGLPAGLSLRVDGLYVGDQVLDNDAPNAQAELPSYTVVNARLSWERALSRAAGSHAGRIGTFVEARNAFDEVYATRGIFAFDFSTFTNETFVTPAPGRRYLVGVTWRM